MTVDLFLDDDLADSEPEYTHDWIMEAIKALQIYIGQEGKRPFTLEQFKQWASYYFNLDDPEDQASWLAFVNSARKRHVIKVASYVKRNDGSNTTRADFWTAA